MPGPWEKFQASSQSDSGPWSKFAAPQQATPVSHPPTWKDDVAASANFFNHEMQGAASVLNPISIAKGLYNTVVHPIDTGIALANLPKTMYDQYQSGDMEGLAGNIGNIAGNVALAKAVPEIPGMASDAAGVIKSGAAAVKPAIGKTAAFVSKVAAPVVESAPWEITKDVAAMFPGGNMVYGPMRGAEGLVKVAGKLNDTLNRPAAIKPVTSNVTISPKISVESASNALGTTAPKLSESAHSTLTQAASDGTLQALAPDVKAAVVQAAKQGDSAAVQQIIADHRAKVRVSDAVENKSDVIARYVQDHNVDISSFMDSAATVRDFVNQNGLDGAKTSTIRKAAASNPDVLAAMDQSQALADAAYGHGVTKVGLKGNKAGRYDGVSYDTLAKAMAKIKQPAASR